MEKIDCSRLLSRFTKKKLPVSRKCDTFSFSHRKINSQDQFSKNFYRVNMINLVRISFFCMLNSFHKLSKFVSEKAIEIITEKMFQKFRNVYYDITTFCFYCLDAIFLKTVKFLLIYMPKPFRMILWKSYSTKCIYAVVTNVLNEFFQQQMFSCLTSGVLV